MTNAHFAAKHGQSESFLAREYYMNKLNIAVEHVVELKDRITHGETRLKMELSFLRWNQL